MEIMAILAAVDAASTLIEKLIPHIEKAMANGEVPIEKQADTQSTLNKLKGQGFKFSRPIGT